MMIVRGRPATLAHVFRDPDTGEALTDVDAATVTITTLDGTSLASAAVATGADGEFSYDLDALDDVDELTVTWDGGSAGEEAVTVPVIGSHLVGVDQMRLLDPLSSTAAYPSASLAVARSKATFALEDECGVAFSPRATTQTWRHVSYRSVTTRWPRLTGVRSVTVDEEDVTDDCTFDEWGQITLATRPTDATVVAVYEHGFPACPARVQRAVAVLAKSYLIDGPADDRATGVTNEMGNYSLLVTAGVRGAHFSLPEVNAVIARFGYHHLGS